MTNEEKQVASVLTVCQDMNAKSFEAVSHEQRHKHGDFRDVALWQSRLQKDLKVLTLTENGQTRHFVLKETDWQAL